jgi:2-polyprenyl-3-methyl-5-hydroxy-6-metoxy-1,4-benzoquinol methylase
MILGSIFSRTLNYLLVRIPLNHRVRIITYLIKNAYYGPDKEESLRFLLEIDRELYSILGEASVRYGGGTHTKHKHIGYHDFFIKNIEPGSKVLDIGSGSGFLAYDIATKVEDTTVLGIDINEENVASARRNFAHPNLKFIVGDAMKDLPRERFDVVVLSNVLEHLEDRVEFLMLLKERISPSKYLIRAPIFERDWRVPLKKELGVDYRLDPTHHIEYTQEEFLDELRQAGLRAEACEVRWGEIWAVARKVS